MCGNFKVGAIYLPFGEPEEEAPLIQIEEPVVEPVRPVEEPEMRKSIVWINVVWWSIVVVLAILKCANVITWSWWTLAGLVGGCLVIGAALTYAGVCGVSFFWGVFGGVHSLQRAEQSSDDGWEKFREEEKKNVRPVRLFGIVNPKAAKKYLGHIIKRRRK